MDRLRRIIHQRAERIKQTYKFIIEQQEQLARLKAEIAVLRFNVEFSQMTVLEIDFSYINLPRERVIGGAILPSGRVVVMTEQDSYWFESDGTSPKGSYLVPWPPPKKTR